ncbi:MmcB family DNA repair protein [Methylovirgula sp. 4M-Z18]|uniref:MmcB family DNA repair protein n=1 Tax=Methylovirgula sp. 4M-Z18 TaxID=2293567 RepID=UPI001FDF7824|nr:MmcB family DNA repair protein [Methylovirgula sp. 4M-Z18]
MPDGRQSETALLIARGARRHLRQLGFATITELILPDGRRADIVALAGDGTIHIVEIKSSVADFRSDTKWPDYRVHCDHLSFAVTQDMPLDIMPQDAGLIVADAYGAAVLRDAPSHRMSGATRRAVLLRFAHAAADRLHLQEDPESGLLS